MRKILLGISILLLVTQPCYCQELKVNDETTKICNEVMGRIYQDILQIKNKYPELTGFDKSALKKREGSDLYSISYWFGIETLRKTREENYTKDNAFTFSLSFANLDEVWQAANFFEDLSYPNLKIKFYGFSTGRNSELKQTITNIVRKNADLLKQADEKLSPIRLTIKSDKQIYGAGEPIIITIDATNKRNSELLLNCYFNANNFLFTSQPIELHLNPKQRLNIKYNLYDLNWQNGVLSYRKYEPMTNLLKLRKYIFLLENSEENIKSNAIAIEVVGKKLSQEEIIAIAKNIPYDLSAMETIYDEGNEKWRQEWYRRRNYFGNLPEIYPPSVNKNYQAVYFAPKEKKGLWAGIWVFVDKDTGKIIEFHEEAN